MTLLRYFLLNFTIFVARPSPGGGMVDTGDLKSLEGNLVRVQVVEW